jgi:hypothetical protein
VAANVRIFCSMYLVNGLELGKLLIHSILLNVHLVMDLGFRWLQMLEFFAQCYLVNGLEHGKLLIHYILLNVH